jgi:hypothetical protein
MVLHNMPHPGSGSPGIAVYAPYVSKRTHSSTPKQNRSHVKRNKESNSIEIRQKTLNEMGLRPMKKFN